MTLKSCRVFKKCTSGKMAVFISRLESQICDVVVVARNIIATLVIPELGKGSFWQDSR